MASTEESTAATGGSSTPALFDNEEPSERLTNAFVLVFLVVLAFCMILSHQMGHKLKFKYLAEAGAVVLVGMLLGGIVMLSSHGRAQEWLSHSISPVVFFIGFLPPIIYCSGYNLKRKVFLYYFVPSILYAVVGTIITTLFVGLILFGLGKTPASYPLSLGEALAFGSLITSTDTVCILSIFERQQVDPLLFYLVFGESVFNDAVVLVLYRIFTSWIGQEITWASMGEAVGEFLLCFAGSMAIGFLFGCAAALLYKHIDLRHSVYEMGIYLLLAYIPYVFSEVIELSGIVCILFTGMFTRHYAHPNLSVEGQSRANFLFSLLSVLAETAVFLQLGLSVFSTKVSHIQPLFIFWTLLLILAGRALNVYPLSWVVNRYTDIKVSRKIQHALWAAGIRGAMAFVCAKGFPDAKGNQAVVETTTMMVVLVTLFGFGTTTIPMLEYLGIPVGVPADDAVNLNATSSQLLQLEEKYLKPFLTRKLALGEGANGGAGRGPGGHSPMGGAAGRVGGPPDIQAMRSRSVWGSYIQNDHIDGLFRMGSTVADSTAPSAGGGGGGLRRPTFTAVDESGSGVGSSGNVFYSGHSGSGTPPPAVRSPMGSPVRGPQPHHPHMHPEHSPRRPSEPVVEEGDEGDGSGPKASVI